MGEPNEHQQNETFQSQSWQWPRDEDSLRRQECHAVGNLIKPTVGL